jgi:hypothetical protein
MQIMTYNSSIPKTKLKNISFSSENKEPLNIDDILPFDRQKAVEEYLRTKSNHYPSEERLGKYLEWQARVAQKLSLSGIKDAPDKRTEDFYRGLFKNVFNIDLPKSKKEINKYLNCVDKYFQDHPGEGD